MRKIVLIAHNLRSAHNVGSLLRTAEGLGIEKVYLTGYTPYPQQANDQRLPHLAKSIHNKISKTALGAESSMPNEHRDDIFEVMQLLKGQDYTICSLEQDTRAIDLPKYKAERRVALILGREVEGVEAEVLGQSDTILQIPMFGSKESFNVAQAAAMALYHLKFVGNI